MFDLAGFSFSYAEQEQTTRVQAGLPDARLALFSVRRLLDACQDSLLLPLLSADCEGACDSKPKAIERPRLSVRSLRKIISNWQKTKGPA
jgi:hypothetical protein